jgi:hypothetical protein
MSMLWEPTRGCEKYVKLNISVINIYTTLSQNDGN